MVQTQIQGGDKKVSDLTATTSVAGTDLLVINQSGATYHITAADFALNIGSAGPVAITSGTIDGVTIGGTTPGAGTFSTLSCPSVTITGGTLNGVTIGGTTPGAGTFTTVVASGGTLDSVTIGGTTPAPGTFTTMTAAIVSGGAFGTGMPTFLATPTSANLAATVTDETGSGSLVFGTSPTLVTPNLGTPSAVTLTNATGYPIATDIHASTSKYPLVSADEFPIWDSVSGTLQKSTWGNMLSQLQTGFTYADATGTSDAITATYSLPGFISLTDGFDLTLGITTPNTTNAPTFAPTINGLAQTARTIVKFVNNVQVPIAVGDLQGDVWLIYDAIGLVWILQTPNLTYVGNIPTAAAGGTADAITATYHTAGSTLTDGYDLVVRIATPNATTTPTFAPTLNGVAATAHTIVKFVGNTAVGLAIADLQGDAWLKYDLANTRWILMNSAAGVVQTAFKNRLINGAMAIDQRNSGAAQTITAGAALAYTVDRWWAACTGANVSGQRVAGTGESQYRYQFTGAASVTAIQFGQRIEQLNSYDLNGQVCTLSVDLSNSLLTSVAWTAYYATTADTFGTLASPTKTQIATGTFTVSSTLTRYSTQITMPAAATTGIEIIFSVGAQTSGTWVIGDVQLEANPGATAFERASYSDEFSRCQRYHYHTIEHVLGVTLNSTDGYNSCLEFPVSMRAIPTLDAGGAYQVSGGTTGTVAIRTGTGQNPSTEAVWFWNSSANWTSSVGVSVTASLTAEL